MGKIKHFQGGVFAFRVDGLTQIYWVRITHGRIKRHRPQG